MSAELVMPSATGRTLACFFGRHSWETIEAIRPLEGASWLLDSECEHSRNVGGKWCPGPELRHDHIPVTRCSRCGESRP